MEAVCKIVFGVAFVWAATVATLSAKLAARTHGKPVSQLANEVRWLIAARAALGIGFYAALFAWIFDWRAADWMAFDAPDRIRILAVVAMLPIMAFFTWSFRSIGANYRGGVGLYDGHALITTGAYARLRHPIY